jgi:hypothetical protein
MFELGSERFRWEKERLISENNGGFCYRFIEAIPTLLSINYGNQKLDKSDIKQS